MKVKKIVLALLVFAVAGATAFAQTGSSGSGRSGSGRYVLTITSNVRGAQVFVNAVRQKGVAPMELTLSTGSYSISVRADGHRDYVANLNLTRNMTLNANLQPITYNLTVTSSTRGSTVYLDGQRRGNAPARLALPGGRYTVMVETAGFHPFTQIVNLTRDTTVNAQLQAMTFRLNVTSNVNGAEVYLGDGMIGKAPLHAEVAPGTYTLRVTAPGYFEVSQIINLQENFNINVNLRKLVSQVTFTVPAAYLNPDVKDPLKLFTLYVDGRRVTGSLAASFEIQAGQHLVRLETGGIIFEAQYLFEPGRDYLLEVGPILQLKPAPIAGR
jgi:hypothetical protein